MLFRSNQGLIPLPHRPGRRLTSPPRNLSPPLQSDVFQFECVYLGKLEHVALELRPAASASWSGRREWRLDSLTVLDLFAGNEWKVLFQDP